MKPRVAKCGNLWIVQINGYAYIEKSWAEAIDFALNGITLFLI
jgi:hypothetical protein